jgi:hypothetical protein
MVHAKARSREGLKTGSPLNERAVGQPGPTREYLIVYKNPLSTCSNKPRRAQSTALQQYPSLPDAESAELFQRVSTRAVSRQKDCMKELKRHPEPVFPKSRISARFPHAPAWWQSCSSSTRKANSRKSWPRWRPACPRTRLATSSQISGEIVRYARPAGLPGGKNAEIIYFFYRPYHDGIDL